jgi:PmbA protein
VRSPEREALAQRVLQRSPSDDTEVIVFDEDASLTRFTHNAIHQNVASSDVVVRVRAVTGGRTGVAATNDLGDDGIARVVARAVEIARLAPPDPEQAELVASPAAAPNPAAYVAATADTSADLRAALARRIFDAAEGSGLWAAGFVTTSRGGVTVANSRGTLQSFDGTESGVNVKQNGPTSSGFAEFYSTDVGALDGAAVGAVAAEKALRSADPVDVAPGEWTVVLEPPAFGELAAFLAEHFSAQSYDEGSSFFSGKRGERFAGENVTIVDDVRHALNPAMPFDYEGTPTQRVVLMEGGAARGLVTDDRWARKLGIDNTGHALPAPNAFGPFAGHLVIEPGTLTRDELVAATKRGLLISRLWYVRTVDQRQTIVTGMTRDGTFLIENGQVTRGVRNLRFNQSIVEALGSCTFARELVRTASYSYSMVVPAVRFERFTFSSTTQF